MKRFMIIVGARPNFVKVTRFKEVAALHGDVHVELVHTGQHSADRMSTIFFDQFNLRPDHFLEIAQGTPTAQIANIMLALEPLLMEKDPDAVIVVGDVNSTLAGALVASRCGYPLVHLESGLRSGDMSMPEEVNRILVDRIADVHLVTEPAGRANLLAEGVPEERIHHVGNTMIDTLAAFDEKIQASPILAGLGLGEGGHVLITMHRPATVDDAGRLAVLVDMLRWLSQDRKVVLPIHPRTKDRLQSHGLWSTLQELKNVLIMEPLDYFAFQKLLATAAFVVTDSGGVQEETTWRGVPCLTLRPNTERPVTISQGTNRLVPFDLPALQQAVAGAVNDVAESARMPDLWDGHATRRAMKVLTSLF